MGLVDRSLFLGSMTLVGGVLGVWAGGVLGDRLGRARPAAYLLVPAAAFLLALPCFVLAIQAQSLVLAFVLFLIPTGLNLVWLGPVITAVQHLAPPAERSTASAWDVLMRLCWRASTRAAAASSSDTASSGGSELGGSRCGA